jgi:hypothetical protein
LFQCQLAGTITLGGVMPASLMQCFGAVNGVTIDMGGTGHALNIAGWHGDLTVANKTGPDPCIIHTATACVTLDPSVTDGAGVHLTGVGIFLNQSAVQPERMELLSSGVLSDSILAAAQADPIHAATQNLDEIAENVWTDRRALSVPKYIGLK